MFEQWLKWEAICWIMLSLQGCEQSSTQPLIVEQAEAYIRHYQA